MHVAAVRSTGVRASCTRRHRGLNTSQNTVLLTLFGGTLSILTTESRDVDCQATVVKESVQLLISKVNL